MQNLQQKIRAGEIFRKNKENFEDEVLLNELFITTRQATEIINTFANNISTDIKLSKAQISEMIQSGGSFESWLCNLGKKSLTNIPLARDNLPRLVSKLASNTADNLERKISRKGAFGAGKGFTIFISNEGIMILLK